MMIICTIYTNEVYSMHLNYASHAAVVVFRFAGKGRVLAELVQRKNDFISTTGNAWLVVANGPVMKSCHYRVDLSADRKGSGRTKTWDLVAMALNSGVGEGQEGKGVDNDDGGLAQAVGAGGVAGLVGEFDLVRVSAAGGEVGAFGPFAGRGGGGAGEEEVEDDASNARAANAYAKRRRVEPRYPEADSIRAARLRELGQLGVRELKRRIIDGGGSVENCLEKNDLVELLGHMEEFSQTQSSSNCACIMS
jgi:hypothetical protein